MLRSLNGASSAHLLSRGIPRKDTRCQEPPCSSGRLRGLNEKGGFKLME